MRLLKTVSMSYREFFIKYPGDVHMVFGDKVIPEGKTYSALEVTVDQDSGIVVAVKDKESEEFIYANYQRY